MIFLQPIQSTDWHDTVAAVAFLVLFVLLAVAGGRYLE